MECAFSPSQCGAVIGSGDAASADRHQSKTCTDWLSRDQPSTLLASKHVAESIKTPGGSSNSKNTETAVVGAQHEQGVPPALLWSVNIALGDIVRDVLLHIFQVRQANVLHLPLFFLSEKRHLHSASTKCARHMEVPASHSKKARSPAVNSLLCDWTESAPRRPVTL